ncbi:phytanoyl-CoA dioxygenase family protein [Paenibacillus agricola]|uniref:Phytanoyl-CoA dioxygenase family protein n=1 Tax=Paenibacillus agricola TaxID=2716264 RepID=A0ABX0JDA4_9BACL|nr:phytanoyl-CoA dioxygenase family protein [Paenibacillus agricola]NHN32199.1 phytanoyl-CoA dioxygenase family protein [Paenibacillus agricola]
MMSTGITPEQWRTYEEQGYLKLGKVLTGMELVALSQRIDHIMLGKAELDYERLMMQREAGEGYEQSGQTNGFKGSTLNYRKIENLEFDPLFLSYMQKPVFREICDKVYGTDIRVSCFRAMFLNKPARNGSVLPFHQDRWTDLDRDPLVTVWTALDPATIENGCVKIFPKTQGHLMNPSNPSGFLTRDQVERLHEVMEPINLELEAGEAVLLHNWTVHGSEGNSSAKSRRAFSVCYMDGETVSAAGKKFSVVFGSGSLQPELIV